MGRPREFEFEAALDQAMQVFWSKGYEGTSLDDLCEAAGLGRSSFYAAFKDKRSLYLQVLQRYEHRAVARVTKALTADMPVCQALAAFLQETIDSIAHGSGRRGCLIGNAVAALDASDPEVAEVARHSMEAREQAFLSGLERAQRRGEFARSADVRALARFITASFQGLRLAGKAHREKTVLEDIAAVMLRCVD